MVSWRQVRLRGGRSGQTAGTDFRRHPRKRFGQIPATVSLGVASLGQDCSPVHVPETAEKHAGGGNE